MNPVIHASFSSPSTPSSSSSTSNPPLLASSSKPKKSMKPKSDRSNSPNGTQRKRDKLRNLISPKNALERLRITKSHQPYLTFEAEPSLEEDTKSQSLLVNLLPELLFYLTKHFLEPSTTALLTLTCKTIFHTLGTRDIVYMNSQKPHTLAHYTQRKQYSILLVEDDLTKRYCDDCEDLHTFTPIHLLKNLSWAEKRKLEKRECDNYCHKFTKNSCFYFLHNNLFNPMLTQMLMKYHRHGKNTNAMLKAMSHLKTDPSNGFVRHLVYSHVCKIRDDRLLVQHKYKVFIPFQASDGEIVERTKHLRVCGHLYRGLGANGNAEFHSFISNEVQKGLTFWDPRSGKFLVPWEEEEDSSASSASGSGSGNSTTNTSSSSSPKLPTKPDRPIFRTCPHCPSTYYTKLYFGNAPKPLKTIPISSRSIITHGPKHPEQKNGALGIYLTLTCYRDLGECKDPWDPVWDCGPHNWWMGECRDRSNWREGGDCLGAEGRSRGKEIEELFDREG